MICPDCIADSRIIACVLEAKYGGEVCPECERVFVPGYNPLNFHYTTKKAMQRKFKRDQKTRAQLNVITAAIQQRWQRSGYSA